MRYYTLVLILLFFGISVNAQQVLRLSGVVRTIEKEVLPYANIRLVNTIDTTKIYGASTDREGRFSVIAPQGIYSLEISYIGYLRQTASVRLDKDVTLPEIILAEDNQMMDEVVVTAKNIIYHANGYVAEISANPFYRNYDLDNILQLTPGTNIIRDEINVYGKRVSKVYVDGRELHLGGADLIQYLRNFNGRNVRRMEVIAGSGVEEDASSAGSAIIKITTVKMEDGGRLSAGVRSNNGSSTHYNTSNVNAQWRIGKWSTYLIGSFGMGNSSSSNSMESYFNDSGRRLLTESSSKGRNRGNISSTVGLGYDIDDRNLITVESLFRTRRNSSRNLTDTRQWESDIANFEPTASGISTNNGNMKMYNLSLNYTHLLTQESSLVFKADRLQNGAERNQQNDYAYIDGDNLQYGNLNEENNLIHTASMDWEKSFSNKTKLMAGLKITDISSKINTDYLSLKNGIKDEMGSYIDRYNYTEQVYALFSRYSFTHTVVNANLGVRLEHAVIFPRSEINPEGNRKSRYTDLFPEAAFLFTVNEEKGHRVTLQYNRSIGRPSMQSLNPLLIQGSEYSYSSGNPLLKPSYSNLYSSRLTLFDRYQLNISYSSSKDRPIRLGFVDPETDIIYIRPENGMKNRSLDIYMEYPLRFGLWGELKLNGSYSLYEEQFGDSKKRNSSWDTGFSGTFRLPYDINVMADIRYDPPHKTLFGKYYSSVYSNVVVNKSFLNRRLTATLMFGDIFNKIGGSRSDSFYNDYTQKQRGTSSTFSVLAGVNYMLNWGNRSAKVRRASTGNTSEQGRLSND